jgi:hypothetical protein
MCGKASTQLIRLTTVIHVISVGFNYLRHLKDSDKEVITDDFKRAVGDSLQNAELTQLFLNIPRASVERGCNMLKYFYFNKMVFANFSEFNEKAVNFEEEIHRYLDRNPILDRRLYNPQSNHDSKLFKKILSINQNVLTTVDLNKRFRMSKQTAIEIFQKLQEKSFGEYLSPQDTRNTCQLPCFKKLKLDSIHSNIVFSNSLSNIGMTLKEFIDNYGDPINVDEYGNTLWPTNLSLPSSSSTHESQVQSTIFTQANTFDSTDGLKSRFILNIDECSKFEMNEYSIDQRPIKTKTTSFMVDQSKEKAFKTNEDIILDGNVGVSTL